MIKFKSINFLDFDYYSFLYGDANLLRKVCEPLTAEEIKKNFYKIFKTKRKDSIFVVYDTAFNERVGLVEVNRQNNSNRYEIGIILDKKFHRKNYPENILSKIILDKNKMRKAYCLIAKVNTKNFPINKTLKKFNFKIYKTIKEYNYWEFNIAD